MENAIVNRGVIYGNAITGDNNVLNFSYMSEGLNNVIVSLAQSQSKLTDAISESMEKRAEADLIRAKAEMLAQENKQVELKLREKEMITNENLINSIHSTLEKIYEKLI